jgi:hypothetical protein
MAHFSIVDKQPGGSGTISIQNAGEAVEIWTVVGDSFNYSTEAVRGSGIFPEVYTTYHALNPRLRLMPIEIKQDSENPSLFVCTLTWTSDKLDPKKVEEDKDADEPLDRIPKITIETQFETDSSHIDFTGKIKTNAAGDLFDPPIPGKRSYKVFKIRKNVENLPDWVLEYDDAVNSLPFEIEGQAVDTGCGWLAYVKLGEKQYDGPTPYREASLEIWVKKRRKPRAAYTVPAIPAGDPMKLAGAASYDVPEEDPATIPPPWDTEQLNEGLYKFAYMRGKDIQRQRCQVFDDTGALVNAVSPVPLTATGDQLYPVTPDNATFVTFRDQEWLDFNLISDLWDGA